MSTTVRVVYDQHVVSLGIQKVSAREQFVNITLDLVRTWTFREPGWRDTCEIK